MKRKLVFETSDGRTFDSQTKAHRHADNRYGSLLLSISKELINNEGLKYGKTTEFIDTHLDYFQQLIDLKRDRDTLEGEDEDL